MAKLSPSILNADFSNLGAELALLESNGVEYLHLDIMDGNYVPNLSFGAGVVQALRAHTGLIFDAHLMVENPDAYLEAFAEAGADIVTVHPETTKHLHRTLSRIRELNMKAGVCLNPSTHPNVLDYIWDVTDLVLLMSVNPGFGGQSYIEKTDEKIIRIKNAIDAQDRKILLEVDGGVKRLEAERLAALGVDLLVVGSDIFQAKDKAERIREYHSILTGIGHSERANFE